MPICPCEDRRVPSDGTADPVTWSPDYRVLPDAGNQSLLMTLDVGSPVLGDCVNGPATPLALLNVDTDAPSRPTLVIARFDASKYYVSSSGMGSISGLEADLVMPDCASAGAADVAADVQGVTIVAPHDIEGMHSYVRLGFQGARVMTRMDHHTVQVRSCSDCSLRDCLELVPGLVTASTSTAVLELTPGSADVDDGVAVISLLKI